MLTKTVMFHCGVRLKYTSVKSHKCFHTACKYDFVIVQFAFLCTCYDQGVISNLYGKYIKKFNVQEIIVVILISSYKLS